MIRKIQERQFPIFLISMILFTAACAGTGEKIEQKPPGKTLAARFWTCADQSQFITVSTGSPDTMRLVLPVGSMFLKAVPSNTGSRYELPGRILTIDGDRAAYSDPRSGDRQCREQRQKSIIEDARYRGVTYRAVGNEPGWVFEVGDQMIVFVSDYGNRTDIFKPTKVKVDRKTGVHRYDTGDGKQKMSALLNDYLCSDTMSGEEFPSTAKITIDQNEYNGCGYWLAPPQN